ncbi:hypothetical protein [Chitinophaga sp. Cy-1792]|uniref:hypothetical protein n=1 Tax=Chitinophaga sp. Cy-1792 TaxID=2608339 RepID=UPI0014225AFA|nr:hypothetical protein [Chitinophaga sp. Cy-1792]NIG57041.1 hypothetical protein [Chitinophaga sp. Cy-1792]
MKTKTNILRVFSLSCLLASAIALFASEAQANNSLFANDNKDKVKKTDNRFVLNTTMPKTNLGLDASYRYTGAFSSDFKFTNTNNNIQTVNIQSVMTFTKGNVTYVVPNNIQVQQQQPGNLNFQRLQIILPLKKG